MTNTSNAPKLTLHLAESRGGDDHGWLSTRHSFSFANWYDPNRMGFGTLRVLNDDTIDPKNGFGTHPHNNMEIITVVTDGTLTHKDSMGNTGVIRAGEVQVMSAGTGVAHSEYNDNEEPLHLFQIWIEPNERNVAPRYDQRSFPEKKISETLLVAPLGTPDALGIHQDAYISRLAFDLDHPIAYKFKRNEHGVYFFVVEGGVTITEASLKERDAIGVERIDMVELSTTEHAVVLAIEVPMSA